MTSFMGADYLGIAHMGTVTVPATRRPMRPQNMGAYSRGVLPTDAIGTFTLTLTNLVVGSAIQIETAAGALVEYRVAASSSEVFTLDAYAPGSASNDLRIKARKGSAAPYYKPFETLATAIVGAQSIYIAQIPD